MRKGGKVVVGGDGQVTLGNTVVKGTRARCAGSAGGQVLAGFAGSTADAFTLFDGWRRSSSGTGQLLRASVELAKDWRTDSTCATSRPC